MAYDMSNPADVFKYLQSVNGVANSSTPAQSSSPAPSYGGQSPFQNSVNTYNNPSPTFQASGSGGSSGTLSPQQKAQYDAITDPNARFAFLNSIGSQQAQQSQQPAQSSTNMSDPYQNILYSKNLWANGNEGQKIWAEDNAKQYYNMITDEAERAKVADMDAGQLQAYINSKTQAQPGAGAGMQFPPNASKPTSLQPNGGLTAEQIQQMLNGQMGNWQTQFGNIIKQITDSSAGNKQYTDQMYAQFQQMMNAMNNQNDERWKKEKELSDAQAKKIADERKAQFGDLITKLTGNQQGELDALQNSFTDAQAGLEDKTFQNWLASRQNIVNTGMQDSGIAQDANTRLMLSRGKDLAGLSRQTQQQMGDVKNKYTDKLSEAARSLAGVSESDIAAQQFQDMYKSGNDKMMEQAKLFADMFGKTLPYSSMKPSDILNGATDWMKQNSQDFWKNQDNQFKNDELVQKSQQFYDELGVKMDQFDSTQKVKMAEIADKSQQFYDKLDQDNYWKSEDNKLEYMKTMLPYQQLTADQTAKYSYYYDKMNADLKATGINAQARVDVATAAAAAKVGAAQAAAAAKVKIEQDKALDKRKIPTDSDVAVFVDNLTPGDDTRASVKADLAKQYSAGQISSEAYLTYQDVSNKMFDDYDKNQAAIKAEKQKVYNDIGTKTKNAITGGWDNILPAGTGSFFKKMFSTIGSSMGGVNFGG